MVILILEKEESGDEGKQIVFVKEVSDMNQAVKDKGDGKHFLHYCYHDKLLADGKSYRRCRRMEI